MGISLFELTIARTPTSSLVPAPFAHDEVIISIHSLKPVKHIAAARAPTGSNLHQDFMIDSMDLDAWSAAMAAFKSGGILENQKSGQKTSSQRRGRGSSKWLTICFWSESQENLERLWACVSNRVTGHGEEACTIDFAMGMLDYTDTCNPEQLQGLGSMAPRLSPEAPEFVPGEPAPLPDAAAAAADPVSDSEEVNTSANEASGSTSGASRESSVTSLEPDAGGEDVNVSPVLETTEAIASSSAAPPLPSSPEPDAEGEDLDDSDVEPAEPFPGISWPEPPSSRWKGKVAVISRRNPGIIGHPLDCLCTDCEQPTLDATSMRAIFGDEAPEHSPRSFREPAAVAPSPPPAAQCTHFARASQPRSFMDVQPFLPGLGLFSESYEKFRRRAALRRLERAAMLRAAFNENAAAQL